MARVCTWCGLPDREWLSGLEGIGSALKPAHEPILIARKPLQGTVAANTLAHGCGGLNVDACRVGMSDADREIVDKRSGGEDQLRRDTWSDGAGGRPAGERFTSADGGRWPTNVVLAHAPELDPVTGEVVGDACADGCVPGCHVAALDEQSGILHAPGSNGSKTPDGMLGTGTFRIHERAQRPGYGDTGGASRFYPTFRYTAKAGKRERPQAWGAHPDCTCEPSRPLDPETGALPPRWRAGTVCATCERPATFRGHSTVKPQDLLRWLLDLLVAPGGYVADLFGGSGSFAQAVTERGDGTRAFVTERDEHSVRLIATRLGVPHDFRSAPLLGEQWVITSPAKGTDDATTAESSNMSRSGNVITDESSPTVSTYTTVTSTSSTTTPTTSSSSTRSHTSDFTPDANCETECGGSRAESATSSSPLTLSTGISHRKAGRSTAAADRVTSASSSRTNESDDSATTTTSREPDTTPIGRIAAATTTAELTRLHAELRGDPECDLDQADLWARVEARWDEISAAARPAARRARTQRPRKPTWA